MPREVFPGITIDPEVQHGRPCLAGTRTPVVSIVGALAGGSSLDEVKSDYFVSEEQIRAALAYAQYWPAVDVCQRVLAALRGLRGQSLRDRLVIVAPSQVIVRQHQ